MVLRTATLKGIPATLFGFVLLLGQNAVGQTPLQWKFQSGESLYYQSVQQTVNKAADQPSLTTTLTVDFHYAVNSVSRNGAASLTQTIDRIRVRVESQQGGSEYDTVSGGEPEGMTKWMAPVFHAVLNQPVTLTMTPRGQVTDLRMSKELLDKTQSALSGDQLSNFFVADGIGQVLGLAILPETPAMPGHRWPHTVTLKNPVLGNQTIESVFTYEGTEDREGRPAEKITSSTRMEFHPAPSQTMMVEVGKQSTRGAIYFDRASGRLLQTDVQSTMRLQTIIASKMLGGEKRPDTLFGGKKFTQDVEIRQHVEQVAGPAVNTTAAQ